MTECTAMDGAVMYGLSEVLAVWMTCHGAAKSRCGPVSSGISGVETRVPPAGD